MPTLRGAQIGGREGESATRYSTPPMSELGQKHELPRRSIAVRFTSMSRPPTGGGFTTLCAKALNRYAIVARCGST